MDTVNVLPAAAEAFQSFYLAELDSRVQRSEVVGAITLKKGNAALFYEQESGKFTLVEKLPDAEVAHVFDCVPREQWGRMVMLFGHATNTGGYIPSGHATLDGNSLKIKLASGQYYRIEVDPALAHLQPFVSAQPAQALEPKAGKPKRPAASRPSSKQPPIAKPDHRHQAQQQTQDGDVDQGDESEDLTAEDLRRLRGEIPLTAKPKKKWKH